MVAAKTGNIWLLTSSYSTIIIIIKAGPRIVDLAIDISIISSSSWDSSIYGFSAAI